MKDIWSLLCCWWRALWILLWIFTWERELNSLFVSSWELPCYVLVFIDVEFEKLTWNVHEHTTVSRKKQPMCSCFVAWCTSVAKNVLFQVKNVLKNIVFFLAIWDSPREVVVQLCISCNWLWLNDIILIHICSFTIMFSRTLFLCKTILFFFL